MQPNVRGSVLSTVAAAVVPAIARLTVSADRATDAALPPGSILAANHTSLIDPAVVLAALRGFGAEPVVLATAGLWRIPLLGRLLTAEGYVPVRRGTTEAARSLDAAAAALAAGRLVLLYGEGGLPRRADAKEAPPGPFRSGLARLARRTGAPVVPVGQAGARHVTSGTRGKQIGGLLSAPVRRPCLHVHLGTPVVLDGDLAEATAHARAAVTVAWSVAAGRAAGPLPAG